MPINQTAVIMRITIEITLEELERVLAPVPEKSREQIIADALAKNSGDIKKTAKELGLSERTIYRFKSR